MMTNPVKVVGNDVELFIKPGQLWMWCFTVGEDGTWFFEVVTEERRNSFMTAGNVLTINRGETFVVVSTDDPGPGTVPGEDLPMLDEMGYMVSPAQPPKRWHVVMLRGTLVWVDQDSFNHAELMGDT